MGEIFSVGLTGGIASGKSVVARCMAELGAVLIDSDQLAREALAPGSAVLGALRARFGDQVFTASGEVDRPALGRIVFADDDARVALNELIHPVVRAEATRRRAQAPAGSLVVEDIPLLVETHQQDRFDYVLVVQSPPEQRIQRMVGIRGMDPADAQVRMDAQATDAQRAAAADRVLHNTGTEGELLEEVTRLTATLLEKAQALN